MFGMEALGTVADLAGGIVDKFWGDKIDEGEAARIKLEIQKAISDRETALVTSQRDIITAELNQSDNYTKRARPTLVYAGLVFIALIHVILPIIAWGALMISGEPLDNMPSIKLPPEFWWAWGGVCSTWIIGRTAEKRGAKNNVVSMITGGGV